MSVRRVQVNEYTCEQCGHVWRARTPAAPDMCPCCHTRLYDRPGPRTEGAPWSREKVTSKAGGPTPSEGEAREPPRYGLGSPGYPRTPYSVNKGVPPPSPRHGLAPGYI